MKTRVAFFHKTEIVGAVIVNHETYQWFNTEPDGISYEGRVYMVNCYRDGKEDKFPEIELYSIQNPDDTQTIHAECWFDDTAVYVYSVEDEFAVGVDAKMPESDDDSGTGEADEGNPWTSANEFSREEANDRTSVPFYDPDDKEVVWSTPFWFERSEALPFLNMMFSLQYPPDGHSYEWTVAPDGKQSVGYTLGWSLNDLDEEQAREQADKIIAMIRMVFEYDGEFKKEPRYRWDGNDWVSP